ncbi:SAV_2336 N-terminal domain-related protein [Streptomyces sp. NPDC093094]|uniref:SAV_2336 N-terminal domain-related protein n=1 Tax=Streptomyces sp. NPDC093094 TaxID=3366026 RepID=UPI003807C9CB
MIEDLSQALRKAGVDAGPDELAEILWLAARIDGGGMRPAGRPDDVRLDTAAAAPPRAHDPGTPAAADGSPRLERFYSAADMAGPPAAGARGVDLVRVRRAASLRDPLAVMRALRPLGRRTGPPGRALAGELDEELTVRSTVEQGLPVPVMRPPRGRWLDLALVVDAHHSMLLWHDLMTELRRAFTQAGVFRDVRTWHLHGTGPGESPSVARTGGGPRSVQEVADPSGHRLVLVVTDTVAEGWSTSGIQEMLRQWCLHGPVALLNVLPRRLWDRGAVRPRPHLVRAPGPAAPNASWRLEQPVRGRRRERHRAVPGDGIAVPVVKGDAASISALAEFVAGDGRWTRFPCLTVTNRPAPPSPRSAPNAQPPATVEEVLRRFEADASTVARTLAGYLSAVPLTLPVLNLVRQVMLPESEPGHLAEVALGGLFESWEQDAREGRANLDRMPFRFRAGVREALLGSQRRDDITAVQALVRRELGAFVTDRSTSGSAGDFLAARGTGSKERRSRHTMSPHAQPFAEQADAPGPVGLSVPERSEPPEPSGGQLPRPGERDDVRTRLREATLRAANGHSALVLLIGDPGSGKSSAVARAVEDMPDGWRLWRPDASLPLAEGAPQVGPRTVVLLDDLQHYTTAAGSFVEEMAFLVRGLIEDTERAPVLILGTLTPEAWDSFLAMARGGPPGFHESCRALIARADVVRFTPAEAAPPQGTGGNPDAGLVTIIGTRGPVAGGSRVEVLGTGLLLGPRLVLTAAHMLHQHSPPEHPKVLIRRGTARAADALDCRVLWNDATHDAALLLIEDGPSPDGPFPTPRWAEPAGDEPIGPCHVATTTGSGDRHAPVGGHRTGILHTTAPHPSATYEFEPVPPLPQSPGTRSWTRLVSGAPVFFGDFFMGHVIAVREDGSGRPRPVVAGIGALSRDQGFTDVCRRYMRDIPRLALLPSAPAGVTGDSRASSGPGERRAQRVFVSHAFERADTLDTERVQRVDKLGQSLRARGFDVYDDHRLRGISPGWGTAMLQARDTADVILVFGSPAYRDHSESHEAGSLAGVAFEARLLRDELTHSPDHGRQRIVPVLMPGSTDADLPDFLRSLDPVVLGPDSDTDFARITARIGQYPATADRPVTAHRARRLIDLAALQWDAGHRTEAVATADRGIEIYRRLTSEDRAAYQPLLARSLVVQSDRLAETGRAEEALRAARDAVDTYEGPWHTTGTARAGRAAALSGLSLRLSEAGRPEDAFTAATESAGLFRSLPAEISSPHLAGFTTSMTRLSELLAESGRREEARALDESLLAQQRRVLGENHPETRATAGRLSVRRTGTARAGEAGGSAENPPAESGARPLHRAPTGRVRHDEKITVYVSAEELMDLEHARMLLRSEHGLAVDRGRIVREALAVVLADMEARADASILVRRLKPGATDVRATAVQTPGPSGDPPPSPEAGTSHGQGPRGRAARDEKITVYVSAEELIDLEHARILLRNEHGLAVDRGRIVREAVAVVLADMEARADASVLVRRLRGR